MKVKKLKKIVSFFSATMVALGLIVAVSSLNTYAAGSNWDDYGYCFDIYSYQKNGKIPNEEAKYRTATNQHNAWKVRCDESTENFSSSTYTNFWMENAGSTNVTATVKVLSNGYTYLRPTYKTAGQTMCYLTAEIIITVLAINKML